MNEIPKYEIEETVDPQEVSRRVTVFPQKISARFEHEKPPEKLLMAFPNLTIREVICFQIVVIAVALLALFFDAPLEELANPQHTPNPAKAPWYFLGLQELLHTFPPVVAGVFLPGLVIIALVIIPYFDINIKREGLWQEKPRRAFWMLTVTVGVIAAFFALFHTYSIAIPTLLLYAFAAIPYFLKREHGWVHWLARRSLAEWVMTWFVVISTVLTLIGTFFRGPGWSWVWPWQ
ncbi:MAG: hypothetical protein ACE5I1_08485 [bacterium]